MEADVSESFSSPALKRFDDIEEWDAAFLKVENEELFEIILAGMLDLLTGQGTTKSDTPPIKPANYLDIKPLLDLGCRAVAGMIKGKTPDMIRDMFNIENDLTPEEEDQIRRENEWGMLSSRLSLTAAYCPLTAANCPILT